MNALEKPITPPHDCALCPRLVAFREKNKAQFPDKFNAPVPSFGPLDAALLVVGLAPGLKGANFTGRPFTGDYAGDLLYPTLIKYGLASGEYKGHSDDGVIMKNARITNAVRCVPPQNKTTTDEENQCRPFLIDEIEKMKNLRVILSLGLVSHNAVLKTFGHTLSAFKFGHDEVHHIHDDFVLIDSYHCSRYNTNTGRLTEAMFHTVFDRIMTYIDKK